MMIPNNSNCDTTIDDIHRERQASAERFGGDIAAILEGARKRKLASGRPVWQAPPPKKASFQATPNTETANCVPSEEANSA